LHSVQVRVVREFLSTIVSWKTFLVALLVFGFAPGAVLRLIVLAFHRDDPRPKRNARRTP